MKRNYNQKESFNLPRRNATMLHWGKKFQRGLLKEIVVGIVIFCLILIPFFNSNVLKYLQKISGPRCNYLDSQVFHEDENRWLHSTKYFKLFFIDKDIHNKQWEDFAAYDQPPVGKYIIGSALFIAGEGDKIKELEDMSVWDSSKDYTWNVAHGAMPPQELLYIARLTMTLFGIFTCLLIYYVGKKVFSMKTGIIASLLLAYNPLMLSYSRRAMTDAPLLFFLTTNIILIMFFYQSFLKQKLLKTFIFAALIGINIALATGTKLNGGIIGVIFASFCILLSFVKVIQYKFSQSAFRASIAKLKSDKEIRVIIGSLLISGVIAIFVFGIINPYLYYQPLKGPVNMIEQRMSTVRIQQENSGLGLTSLSEKFNFVIRRTLFPRNYVILGNIFKIPIDFGLFLLGLTMLLYTEGKYFLKNYKPSLRSIIVIWIGITFVGIIAWIPLDWDRYYLPVIPCIVMMLGYSIAQIIDKCWAIVNKIMLREKE